jgi:hypothetical protein
MNMEDPITMCFALVVFQVVGVLLLARLLFILEKEN